MFYYMHKNNNYQCKIYWIKVLYMFGEPSIILRLSGLLHVFINTDWCFTKCTKKIIINAKYAGARPRLLALCSPNIFSIQMLLHFSQIVPMVCTLMLFIYLWGRSEIYEVGHLAHEVGHLFRGRSEIYEAGHLFYGVGPKSMASVIYVTRSVIYVTRSIRRQVACYEQNKEIDKLDFLVYHVDRV